MTMKKLILLAVLFLLTAGSSFADEGQTYTIRKGDTLWGISERFVSDPFYWPNLWSKNQFITNPHLIYPGQKVIIRNGRIEFVGEGQPESAVQPVTAGVANQTPNVKVDSNRTARIRAATDTGSFISTDQMPGTGEVIATSDDRLFMAAGDEIFIRFDDLSAVKAGDKYNLFDVGNKVKHPISKKSLGYHISRLGVVTITTVDAHVATATVDSNNLEIQRGARALPYQEPVRDVALNEAESKISGVLISANEDKIILSQYDVIYMDKGRADGMEQGNLLYITRQREVDGTPLPEDLLGAAVVLELQEKTCSALVLKSVQEMYRGDTIYTVTTEAIQ